jgi:hypothetical protein
MKIGIMQPYFMPYIGYFQLMKAVDKYVIYDDVNYIKGGWVSRNYIVVNGEKKMFTIMLKGASPNKLFNEIEIGDDFRKFLKTLQINYSKTPFYESVMDLMNRIVSFPNKNLSVFIKNSFNEILQYLNINTELIMSSSLDKDISYKGVDKVIQICKILNADTYYNAINGKDLYNRSDFEKYGINLNFINTLTKNYHQQHTKEFIPYLSIIDVLMNNSVEETNKLLDSYNLL